MIAVKVKRNYLIGKSSVGVRKLARTKRNEEALIMDMLLGNDELLGVSATRSDRFSHVCSKCGHEWQSLKEHPLVCKKCISYEWV